MPWRDTMRPARFLVFDGRLVFCLLPFFFHISWMFFYLAIGSMVVFWLLERRGLSVPAAMRRARSWLAGPRRPARLGDLPK
jgi:hypothetical protein